MPRVTGAVLAARTLKDLGVDRIFGLCGDHINSLYHACSGAGITIIGTRHESAAVHMADGVARATGAAGVALVTGGPGHTNAITGMAVAQAAYSPVLLISGQAPLARRERGGNQALQQAEIMRSVTKWSHEVTDAELLPEFIARAFRIAASGTPGPVSLSIPVDVADAAVRRAYPGVAYRALPEARHVQAPREARGEAVVQAASMLARARRPVILLGGGGWSHGEREMLADAIGRIGAPAFTTGAARGLVPDDGKYCFGYGNPAFNATFREIRSADVVLLAGAALDYHTAYGDPRLVNPRAAIIQLHHDARQIGLNRTPALAVLGPCAPALRGIARALPGTAKRRAAQSRAWLARVRRAYARQQRYWRTGVQRESCGPATIHPLQVCDSLSRHWSPRTRIVADVGDFSNWPKAYFPALRPGGALDGGAMGALGASLPLAMGVQSAFPRDAVWVFVGDGGFGFHAWELSTAVEHGLPVKIVVGNDRAWGTEKRLQRASFGCDVGCDLPDIRYDRFAETLGTKGVFARDRRELDAAVDELVAARGPCVLNVELRTQPGRPFAGRNRT